MNKSIVYFSIFNLALVLSVISVIKVSNVSVPKNSSKQTKLSTEKTFYISPQGNDKDDGSLKHPFLTLNRAKEAILNSNNKFIKIYLRNGYYSLDQSFTLSKESVTSDKHVLISSYPNEKAHIIGGKRITGFKKLRSSDPDYKRIDPVSRKHILTINLRKKGITEYGKITPRGFGRPITPSGLQLFFNNKQMTLARWPNNDWTTIKEVPEYLNNKGFVYKNNRPERWVNATDVWLHGYWKYDWSDTYVRVADIDTGKKIISTEAPHSGYPFTKGKRYYALNLLEELDMPGEWYLNRKSGILYFWPPADINRSDTFVSVLQKPLIQLDHVENVTIKDLIFEFTSGAGIEIIGGKSNKIDNCKLRNIGTVAVSIGKMEPNLGNVIYKNTLYNGDAGHYNGVENCEIFETGEGGIILGGGDRKSLTKGNNYAVNNKIYDCSRWVRTYRAGIYMYGAGNIVQHNLIYNLPHTALFFWGNDHLIEYNEIHHVCMETGDAGAFYNGRDWTQRGSLIRFNYFHDLHGVEGQKGWNEVMAIYLDDWSSGATIFGNIFKDAGRSVMIGGGRDNLVENNIIIDGSPAIHVDSRGKGWAKYYFDGSNNTLFERLAAVQPDKPPYSKHYPGLTSIPKEDPDLPVGNRIIKNISSGGKWVELLNKETKPLVFFEDNVIDINKKYLLDKNGQISIQYKAFELPKGFQPIPFDKIGLKKNTATTR
jgi:hypothetical protein